MAASYIEEGKLYVFIVGHEIVSKEYSNFWIPSETRIKQIK